MPMSNFIFNSKKIGKGTSFHQIYQFVLQAYNVMQV